MIGALLTTGIHHVNNNSVTKLLKSLKNHRNKILIGTLLTTGIHLSKRNTGTPSWGVISHVIRSRLRALYNEDKKLYTLELPQFVNKKKLRQNSAWYQYLQRVYGSKLHKMPFPFDTSKLWILYTDICRDCGIQFTKLPTRGCPKPETEKVKQTDVVCFKNMSLLHDKADTIWIYHPRLYKSIPNYKRVEVIHTNDVLSSHHESNNNYWMYYAPGTGVWFDVGKTISFSYHREALCYFGIDGKIDYLKANPFNMLFEAAIARGYDSLQFLQNNGGRCNEGEEGTITRGSMNMFEIVSLRGNGTTTCGGDNIQFFKGFGTEPCKCKETSKVVNCDG